MAWAFMVVAIVSELFGTLGLRALAAHVTWWAIVLIAFAYVVSFVALGVTLRQLNVGTVYAIWSAAGTAAVAGAGVLLFGERLSVQAVAGMAIIVVGVVVLVTSGSVRHA